MRPAAEAFTIAIGVEVLVAIGIFGAIIIITGALV